MTDQMIVAPANRLSVPEPHQLWAQYLAGRTLRWLSTATTLLPGKVGVFVIPRSDRAILIINQDALQAVLVPEVFYKRLPGVFPGHRMAVDTARGIIQVAYQPDPPRQLVSVPLNLTQQPGPLHVPIGLTGKKGALWLSILEMDSVLIGGARRMGKTRWLHGCTQALLKGGQATLVMWDGKGGVEFARYASLGAVVAKDLTAALSWVQEEVARRQELFRQKRVVSLPDYNAKASGEPLPPIVLILDELADIEPGAEQILIELVRRAGAYGVHPVIGIQRPDAGVMKGQLRANLSTRIALPVASNADSQIILARSGAQNLPKTRGRLLFVWDARLIEAQAFQIELPDTGEVLTEPNGPELTRREIALVRAALELGGWFNIRQISEKTREGINWVNDIAIRWEATGWLTSIKRNAQGHPQGRQITQSLADAAGLGDLFSTIPDQADLADLATYSG